MLKRNHVLIALLLFFLYTIRPHITSQGISINVDPSLNNNLLPPLVLFGAIFPDFDLRFLHRKLLHNLFVVALVCLGLYYLGGLSYSTAFSLGAITHIIMDSVTEHGTYIFYPILRKFRLRGVISTGTWEESAIMIMIVTMIISTYLVYDYFRFSRTIEEFVKLDCRT